VKPLLDKCLQVSSEFARVLVEEGADVIAIGNASSSMDVLSPRTYLENLAGYDRKLAEDIRKTGALVQMHICGNITPILGELDRSVDIVDVDHKVNILDAIASLRQATLKGNLDPSVPRFSEVGEVKSQTSDIVNAVRSSGRKGLFVFSTGCEVPPGTPHAAIKAMVAVARGAWGAGR
jgi:uroporphyrinogen-III decarboxylase